MELKIEPVTKVVEAVTNNETKLLSALEQLNSRRTSTRAKSQWSLWQINRNQVQGKAGEKLWKTKRTERVAMGQQKG